MAAQHQVLPALHETIGYLLALGYLAAAIYGFAAHFRGRSRLPRRVWSFLRLLAALFAVQIVLGVILLASARPLPTSMHLLYAALIFLGVGAQEMLRPGGSLRRRLEEHDPAFRESLNLGLITFVLFALAGRALMTGLLGR